MSEWICFWVTAAALVAGLLFLTAGVLGNCRFGCAMNRLHAAGLGDTMGLMFTTVALAVSAPSVPVCAKLFLPLIFLWITSPVSTHFLSMVESRNMRESEKIWN